MAITVQTDSVAADMERIFRPLAGRTVSAAPREAAGAVPARRRAKWLLFAAPVAVLVAGVALGVDYVGDAWRPKAAAARHATPADYRVARTDDRPAAAIANGVAPADAVVPARDDDPTLAEAPPPLRADGAGEALADATPTRTAPDPRVSVRTASVAARDGRSFDRAARPAPARRGGGGGSAYPDCAPGSLDDRCIYQDVLDADERLRRAFDRAKQDGVANRDLATVTRRWRQARDLATDDPDGTIRRYGQLAETLDEMRRETGQ